MLADYFTKPIKGYLFHKSHVIIMGGFINYTLLQDIASSSGKESVGEDIPVKEIP